MAAPARRKIRRRTWVIVACLWYFVGIGSAALTIAALVAHDPLDFDFWWRVGYGAFAFAAAVYFTVTSITTPRS